MKTKNIIAILVALPIMAGLTGCKSEDELTAKPAKEMLRVLGGDIEIRATDETTVVNVSADCHWRVQDLSTGDFGNSLTVQPREGDGDGSLIISTDQNETKSNREATFTLISDGGLQQKVTIRQTPAAGALNLSSTNFQFNADATSVKDITRTVESFTIRSNSTWQIQTPSGVSWVHLSKTSGGSSSATAAETVEISVDKAVSDASRSATLTVTSEGNVVEIQVSQEGMNNVYLKAQSELINFGYQDGFQELGVESNAEWQAYIPSSCTWLHFEESRDSTGTIRSGSGIGNGMLRVRCDYNNTSRARLTAIVIIAGSKNPQQVVVLVEQAPNGTQQATLTVGDLTSMYVADTSAEFRFSFVSDEEVADYGLVYSATEQMPTRENAEVVTVGRGGFGGNVMATLENLQPSTTYYVRAYVLGTTLGRFYSPNVVTIRTSSSQHEPGESDNPDPTLAPRQ